MSTSENKNPKDPVFRARFEVVRCNELTREGVMALLRQYVGAEEFDSREDEFRAVADQLVAGHSSRLVTLKPTDMDKDRSCKFTGVCRDKMHPQSWFLTKEWRLSRPIIPKTIVSFTGDRLEFTAEDEKQLLEQYRLLEPKAANTGKKYFVEIDRDTNMLHYIAAERIYLHPTLFGMPLKEKMREQLREGKTITMGISHPYSDKHIILYNVRVSALEHGKIVRELKLDEKGVPQTMPAKKWEELSDELYGKQQAANADPDEKLTREMPLDPMQMTRDEALKALANQEKRLREASHHNTPVISK